MPSIIYDVAVSIDGYISGPDGDVSQFAHDGPVVEAYQARLGTYAAAIMGKTTYTFAYEFGMPPGANPYPAMQTYIMSATLDVPEDSAVTVVRDDLNAALMELRSNADGDIYLCGGGVFAAGVLLAGQLDRLRIKRSPIILGGGVPLFGPRSPSPKLTCTETQVYPDGYVYQDYIVD